jgi:hypothetical protein
MKNFTAVLTMLLMTASAMGQTSRREANNNIPVRKHNEHPAANPSNHIENRRNIDNGTNTYRNSEKVLHAFNREYRGGREVTYHYPVPPKPREYRRVHYPYPSPVHFSFYWTPEIRYEYVRLYPAIGYYKYPVGYRIENVSAYDALHCRGEIANVYGKVFEVYYSRYNDEYILYFGAYYPYHDFTAIIPGEIARRYSPWPEWYFEKEQLIITGLITLYEGTPEIDVRTNSQIRLY